MFIKEFEIMYKILTSCCLVLKVLFFSFWAGEGGLDLFLSKEEYLYVGEVQREVCLCI